MLMIFVSAIADLPEALWITGDGRTVIGQVLPVHSAFPLKTDESLSGFFGDGCEEFTASLGGDALAVGMPMNCGPAGETAQGIS